MAQQFMTSTGAAVGPRIQEIDQTGVVVSRPVGVWRYAAWGAVFAGAFMAISVQLLLALLGAGIGLLVIGGTGADPDTVTGFTIGAGIWWLISGIISLWIGGVVAGRLCRASQATDAVFHGLLVWALTTVLSIAFLTTAAAGLVGGMFAGLGQFLPAEQMRAAAGTPTRVGAAPAPAAAPGAGEDAADRRVGGFADEGDGTTVTTEEAASTAGQAALWSFFALTLGAVAGGIGGAMGRYMFSRYDEETTIVSRTPTATGQPTTTTTTTGGTTNV